MPRRMRQPQAFTMIELLVVISIIGLLVSILLPSLAAARHSTRYVQAASVMRQMYMSVALYGSDSHGAFPYFATPRDPFGPVVVYGVDLRRAQGRYYAPQASHWPSLLRRYISGRPQLPQRDAMIPVGERFGLSPDRNDEVLFTRFELSYTVFSAPEEWYADETPRIRSYYRGTNWDEIRFPSQKGLLVDIHWLSREVLRTGIPTLSFTMADGATDRMRWEDMKDDLVYRRGAVTIMPVMNTRYGLHGRDR